MIVVSTFRFFLFVGGRIVMRKGRCLLPESIIMHLTVMDYEDDDDDY